MSSSCFIIRPLLIHSEQKKNFRNFLHKGHRCTLGLSELVVDTWSEIWKILGAVLVVESSELIVVISGAFTQKTCNDLLRWVCNLELVIKILLLDFARDANLNKKSLVSLYYVLLKMFINRTRLCCCKWQMWHSAGLALYWLHKHNGNKVYLLLITFSFYGNILSLLSMNSARTSHCTKLN